MNTLPISALVHNTSSDNIEYLPMALQSVWFCSQKLFIADKSSQESLALAEKFGFEIHHYEGENSMADRRNFGISLAKNELMLQCDSDEVYEPDAYLKLRNIFFEQTHIPSECYAVQLYNIDKERGVLMSTSPLERLYRKGAYFTKSVQNELHYEGIPAGLPIKIEHYGYGAEKHQRKQWARIKHNEGMVRCQPEDMHTRMYLINALVVAGGGSVLMYERVLAQTNICLRQYHSEPKDNLSKNIMQKVMRFFWIMCQSVGHSGDFLEVSRSVIKDIKFHPDTHFWMFASCMETGDAKEALRWGESFIKMVEKPHPTLEVTTSEEAQRVKDTIIHILSTRNDKWAKKQLKRWVK